MLFRLHKVLGTVKLKILIKSQSKRRIGLNILGTFRSKLMVSWMTQTPEKFYNNLLKNKVRFKKKKKMKTRSHSPLYSKRSNEYIYPILLLSLSVYFDVLFQMFKMIFKKTFAGIWSCVFKSEKLWHLVDEKLILQRLINALMTHGKRRCYD